MAPLTQAQLLDKILESISESRWQALLIDSHKPFQLRVFQENQTGFNLIIYIWNCTHGGGSARANDEYRVQITGVIPIVFEDAITLLLGWHQGYEVFVGFDIRKHTGQSSQSPSIQVKEETLRNAHNRSFAIYHRQNNEIAVAFRQEFLIEYALSVKTLHDVGEAQQDLSLLNDLESLTNNEIITVKNQERQIILSQIARRYRAHDFRSRVLTAYGHRCAICGVQLGLVDASHIIPVAASSGNDETRNGVALCKLHHAAFDQNLISFDENYKIEVSEFAVNSLKEVNQIGGITDFRKQLKTALLLPADKRDRPPPEYIYEARKIRNWR